MRRTLTMNEVADRLGVCYDTVRRWCRDGHLPSVRAPRGHLVRVPVQAVEAIENGEPTRPPEAA
ncbi:MAG: helix-turn-helix domain-containing protein [Gemmatimonadales bacterium]